jgi:Domain of Unknown Function with PDB structure (DUF3857)
VYKTRCMKHCLTNIILVLVTVCGMAQSKLPEFGKIDKEDLLLKEYANDKSVPAMVLAHQGSVTFNFDIGRSTFDMDRTIHKRVKVFSTKGQNEADVKIIFRSDDKYEQVSNISGYTYNLDAAGEIVKTKLEKTQVLKNKETDELSSTSFSLPEVKPGSVFEYRYTVTKRSYTNIDPWIFQDDIPTRFSAFEIEMPEYFRFTPRLNVNGSSKLEKKQEDGVRTSNLGRMGVTTYRYTLRDVDALRMEPYMTGYKDYLQRLELQLSELIIPNGFNISYTTTWQKLAEELHENDYFGQQLRKKISIPELENSLEKITGNKERIEFIHRYVRTHFDWDGREDFTSLNVKKINEKRNGTTGDINLLLLNLLQHNDIEAYPILVSTRDHGRVFTGYPFLRQFNSLNVMAKDGEKWYIMNGADKYTPTHLIPADVMTTEALMVDKKNSSWVTLWDASMMERHNVSYMATLSENGLLSGDAFVTSTGYAKNPRIKALKDGNDKYIQKYFTDVTTGIIIDDFVTKNADNDTLSLEQKFKFKYKINTSGDYAYFNTNLFTGLEENPFVAENRISDIDFGHNRRIALNTRVVLPDNYQVDELPKNIRMIMPDTSISFSRSYFQEENTVALRIVLEFNRPVFAAAEYPEFKDFYKKMFEMLSEQVVLKKK